MADQPTSSKASETSSSSEPSAASAPEVKPGCGYPSESSEEYTNSREKVPLPNEATFPTIRGPNSSFVKLISKDGHEFFLRRRYAFISPTIRDMMGGPIPYENDEELNLNLNDMTSHALKRTTEYFIYFYRYDECWFEIPPFPISAEEAVDLMLAASFFNC